MNGGTRIGAAPATWSGPQGSAWRRESTDAATWEELARGVASGELHFDGFSTIMTPAEREARRWPRPGPRGVEQVLAIMGRRNGA